MGIYKGGPRDPQEAPRRHPKEASRRHPGGTQGPPGDTQEALGDPPGDTRDEGGPGRPLIESNASNGDKIYTIPFVEPAKKSSDMATQRKHNKNLHV